jgi:hypothetical protein
LQEVFLDYGDEWETAWKYHVGNWTVSNETYLSAAHYNNFPEIRLPTAFELLVNPLENMQLTVSSAFAEGKWKDHVKSGGTYDEFVLKNPVYREDCSILRYREAKDGTILYTAAIVYEKERNDSEDSDSEDDANEDDINILVDMPREAFLFYDLPYTTDMHLDNAFRHEIRIPDELFPLSWRFDEED